MNHADLSSEAQAAQFLAALAPGESQYTFQTFSDGPRAGKHDPLAHIYHGTLAEHFAKLVELNEAGAGVFVMVNAGDGRGRTKANVERVRAVFLDLDGAPFEPVEAGMPKAHIVVLTSPGKRHAYWRVADVGLRDFREIQKILAKRFNGDPKVIDLPRVMRVPGFYHRKASPFMVTSLQTHPELPAYKYEDLRAALRAPAGAPEGERNDTCFRFCASLRSKGIPLDQAEHEVLQYALKCTPPMDSDEALRTLHGAYEKYPAGFSAEIELHDSDHYRLAQAVIAAIETETGERPVYAQGALWSVKDAVWTARSLDNVAVDVARMFAGGKYCKRGSDFNSIAQVVAKLCEDEKFFEGSEIGIAAPGGFWRVSTEGEILQEPLTPDHRQRMRVAADPELNAEPRLLLRVLAYAFDGKEVRHKHDSCSNSSAAR